MKKIFLLTFLGLTIIVNGYSQDIIKTNSGEEIKAMLLKLNRKSAVYKSNDDPEFNTYTIPYSKLASIQMKGEKKPIYFNHNLPRAFIVGSMGVSVPLGDFAKTNYEDAKVEPGFAKPWANLSFEAGFYVIKRLGLNIYLANGYNRFDYDAYSDLYNGSSSNNDYVAREDVSLNWILSSSLIGPMYSIKLGKRITWDLIGRAGVVGVSKPGITLLQNSTGQRYDFISDQKTSFSLNGGTNIRIMFSKRLAFFLSGNYIRTNTQINTTFTTTQYINNQPNSIESSVEIDYKIATLNLNAGLAFNFKRKGNKYE